MSRPSTSATRNLTLTEELEKLEQSITLTLQEIDHNFSRAHRIVTTSILPIVEQYAKHSEAVWKGSKFWKQFFEASANVSLFGYEEAPEDLTHDETATTTHHEEETYDSPSRADDTITTAGAQQQDGHDHDNDSSLLESPSLTHAHSTPRIPASAKAIKPAATFASYPSPYEALKREMAGEDADANLSSPPLATDDPITPGKPQPLPDMSMTPQSSPFTHPSGLPPSTQRRTNNDPLLHRVLDKTYRIAATPHTQQRRAQPKKAVGATPQTANRARRAAQDSSPMSSPLAAPQLRPEIFSSPAKAPRTPGVSVVTPGTFGKRGGTAGREASAVSTAGMMRTTAVWEDSDEEEETEFSPPKTMQFVVPPGRLLQTPAREASKRIVEDLLLTAGGDITDELEEDSPSVVRRNQEEDFSFS